MGSFANPRLKSFKSITAHFVVLAFQNRGATSGSKDWRKKVGRFGATPYKVSYFHMTGSSFNPLLHRTATPSAARPLAFGVTGRS